MVPKNHKKKISEEKLNINEFPELMNLDLIDDYLNSKDDDVIKFLHKKRKLKNKNQIIKKHKKKSDEKKIKNSQKEVKKSDKRDEKIKSKKVLKLKKIK